MRAWQRSVIAGGIAGVAAAAGFLVLHAIVIVPIWPGVGMLSAAIAGALIAIAFHLVGQSADFGSALRLGLLLWFVLLPPTIVVALMHGVVPEPLEIAAAVASTVLYGAAVALLARRHWSAALSGALAAAAVLVVDGGPLTHFTRRPILIYAGLLSVDVLFALCLVAALRLMHWLDSRRAGLRSIPDQRTHSIS